MALDGSMNRPPSENESGVTLRTPMTNGRPNASRLASGLVACLCSPAGPAWGRETIMRPLCAGRAMGVKRRSIGDLLRQLAGVLDPAADKLLGRKKANQLSLLVGLGHRARQPGRIAEFQFLHRIHSDFAQQPGIFLAHALDA